MRAHWEKLYRPLFRSVTTERASVMFAQAKQHTEVLRRFAEPATLLDYLHDRHGNLDEKDAVYAALVDAVQRARPWGQLAMALLWCGLSPALESIYRRRLRHFRAEPEELISAIAVAFSALIARIDCRRARRVAACLVWGTERDLMRQRRAVWAAQALIDPDASFEEASDARVSTEAAVNVLGEMFAELASLQEWLMSLAGEQDAELLVSVYILDTTQAEAAKRVGLSHDATRKRIQRALQRLRAHMARPDCP